MSQLTGARRDALPRPKLPRGMVSVCLLYMIQSMAVALSASTVPVGAYRLLGTGRNVGLAYAAAGIVAVTLGQFVPRLLRRYRRRQVWTLAAVTVASGYLLLSLPAVFCLIPGLALKAVGWSALAAVLNLFILDTIDRHALVRAEPLRLFLGAACWSVGPSLGALLADRLVPWAANAAGAGVVLAGIGCLYLLPVPDPQPRGPAPAILANLRRFAARRRLRLAWALAFGRSCWWSMFFVYAPILALQAGHGPALAGYVVSAGNLSLVLTPLYGRLAARRGLRTVLSLAFLATAAATLAAGLTAGTEPLVGAALLVLASTFIVAVDGLASVAFLRMVSAEERPEMAMVYGTYKDLSDLVTPAACAAILTVAPLGWLFAAAGAGVFACAGVARALPRRL